MTEHLPECEAYRDECGGGCICHHVRACEERVQKSMDRAWEETFIAGVAYTRIKTLDDARKAVSDRLEPEHENTCWPLVFGVIAPCLTCKALAAIDALKEGS